MFEAKCNRLIKHVNPVLGGVKHGVRIRDTICALHVPKKPPGRSFKRVWELSWSSTMSSLNPRLRGQTDSPSCRLQHILSDKRRLGKVCHHMALIDDPHLNSTYCYLHLQPSLTASFHISRYICIHIREKPLNRGTTDKMKLNSRSVFIWRPRLCESQWVMHCCRLKAIKWIKSTGCLLCIIKKDFLKMSSVITKMITIISLSYYHAAMLAALRGYTHRVV